MMDMSPWAAAGAFLIAAMASLVGMDFISRLRTATHPTYRIPWLLAGGLLLGGGMWAAHFLWSEALHGSFQPEHILPLTCGLMVSCIGGLLLLWIASSPWAKAVSTMSMVALIFASFMGMSYFWMIDHQIEHPDVPRGEALFVLSLLLCGTLSTWLAKRRREMGGGRTFTYAILSTMGILAVGYASFRLSSYLLGVPIVRGNGDDIPSLVVFIIGSVLLVAAWVVSFFERRFTNTLRKHEKAEADLLASKNDARAIVDTAFDAFVSTDENGSVIEWNAQAQRTFGWARSEAYGRNWIPLIFEEGDSVRRVEELKANIASGQSSSQHRVELTATHKKGARFPVELTIWPTFTGGGVIYNAFLHDISERRKSERRLAAQTSATAALLEAATIEEAAPKILSAICTALGWSVGTMWLAEDQGSKLRCRHVWTEEEGAFPVFRQSAEALVLDVGIGIPGRILMSGKPIWIPDVAHDSWFSRAKAAEVEGLHGAFGFPIWGDHGPLGVIEFFSSSIEEPDRELLEMMDTIGTLAGAFIQSKNSVEELASERMFLTGLLENLSDGIVACNKDGMLTVFNRATREFHSLPQMPIPAEEWARHYGLLMPDGAPMVKSQVPLFRALNGETVRDVEVVVSPPDGKRRTLVCNGQPLINAHGELMGAVVAMHDITENKVAEEKLKQLAHYDPLTALPNRALFYETLAHAISEAEVSEESLCVMFLDLDRFKEVNDTMGHAAGDELLRQVALRLARCLRAQDTVGRMGGDEFAIIIPEPDSIPTLAHIADKIRHALSQPFNVDAKEVTVSTSIGITCFPDDSTEMECLVQFADTAMYAAKAAGKDQYRFYTSEMNESALKRMEMEASLKRAVENGEFILYYQPKVSMHTGDITGLEALLRWNHPKKGIVLPDQFVPILEETGLIDVVGSWVLRKSCEQLATWNSQGIDVPRIAVNVSARQFLQAHHERRGEHRWNYFSLEQSITQLLEQHPEAAGKIELELTESTVMSSADRAIALLEHLKGLGVTIAIDDFGTGYSSLSYLKRLPIDSIKIDQEFVRDVVTDGDDAAIIAAIINMSHSMGLKVIAEGVENQDQLSFLQSSGCDEVQGYLIARPFLPDELKSFLASNRQHVATTS